MQLSVSTLKTIRVQHLSSEGAGQQCAASPCLVLGWLCHTAAPADRPAGFCIGNQNLHCRDRSESEILHLVSETAENLNSFVKTQRFKLQQINFFSYNLALTEQLWWHIANQNSIVHLDKLLCWWCRLCTCCAWTSLSQCSLLQEVYPTSWSSPCRI